MCIRDSNWSTQKAFIDTAIIGVRNPAEAHENCNGFGWSLTGEEMARIDAAIEATVGRCCLLYTSRCV